jgi:molecular chaperone DnaK
MSRTTIDFGIDLGTTNSAIAVMRGTVTDIVKNNMDNDITPSAVFIDKHKQIQVGQLAKNRQEDQNATNDVYIEFKRRMGTDHKYEFKTAGRTMKPEELSAEVLKSLRGDVQQRLGEDVQACVITVPAAFEMRQCDATKRAGELAGFSQCPLIMEPTAAALAYGFQLDVAKEYWLVYDFGGGTFDACLMKAEDGSISIVNNGGDNYLGGSDIDWAIVEQLIIPKLTADHNLPDLSRGNTKWRTALAVVKRAAEIAKIQLSRSETAYLEDCRIKDADGEEIEIDFKLTRDAVIGVAEPIIMKSVEVCKRVLKEKNLSPSAIKKVILVGGPTLAPYFREILHSNLDIQLDHSVDPLTVVAKGAAVFAGTQRLEGNAAPKASVGEFNIDIKYKPMGPDEDPTVRGEVQSESGTSVEGFTIEFINQQTQWRSGKLPIKSDGRFKVNLMAEKKIQNLFDIELLDKNGRKQVSVPAQVPYIITQNLSEQNNIHSIAVALANNEAEVFFKKGEPLPAKNMQAFRSSGALKKGESGNILKIPVVEGENALSDRNVLLGSLDIEGAKIRRDVPAGSEIEVTLNIDASRIIRAKAYIPVLDEEFEAVIDYNRKSADPKRLKREYDAELKRLKSLRDQAGKAEDEKANELLDDVGATDEIESLLSAAKGDPDAANKGARELLRMKIKIDKAEDELKWPAMVTEANKALDALDSLIEEVPEGSAKYQEKANKLREQVNGLIEDKYTDALRKKMEQVGDLHREILFAQPGFWVGFFNSLVNDMNKMQDQTAAARLVSQGRQCITQGNVDGLRNVDFQLLSLLPTQVAADMQRGLLGSGEVGLLK